MDLNDTSSRSRVATDHDSAHRDGSNGRDYVLAGAVLAGTAFLYAPTVVWLVDRWTRGVWSQNAHGMLVPLVVGYVAWLKLRESQSLQKSASSLGFLLLVPALLMQSIDAGIHTQLLSAISLIVALPGLSLLFLGTERTKRIALLFPFLTFMLPLPFALTEQVYFALRQIATNGSGSAISALGIPVFTEGTTIHLAGASLEVVNACSGFGTLYASMAVAAMSAYMSRSIQRRVLVMMVAAPLAVAANVLRVVILLYLFSGREGRFWTRRCIPFRA